MGGRPPLNLKVLGGITLNDTLLLSAAGIVIAALAYFAGQQRADARYQRERQDRQHLEDIATNRATADKLIGEFVETVRRHRADGPYALAELGLEVLGTDTAIRDAIREMEIRTKSDPWSGQAAHVEGVDLVRFFRTVRLEGVNFADTTVEEVVRRVRQEEQS